MRQMCPRVRQHALIDRIDELKFHRVLIMYIYTLFVSCARCILGHMRGDIGQEINNETI